MVRWGSGGRLCLKKSLGRKEPSAPVGRPSRSLPRKVPPVARRKVIPKIIMAPLLLESEGWASDGSRHHSARRDPYGGPVQVQEVRQDFVEIRKLLRRTDGEGALALARRTRVGRRMVSPAASSASDSSPGGCFSPSAARRAVAPAGYSHFDKEESKWHYGKTHQEGVREEQRREKMDQRK